ncbi:fungal-specific transcription factor domain-containing protein [Fusarium redolens]|uniref:Fungal-specific transcription factor domain-containing protein n=1 Tax=Fusarium redolens TaxID=48865 RepID=A0A9P9KUU2_FUSRE|nr:fungal-specific transcription factor domain-containing protein [Fusarium redolens]KAH7268993.1 fungal-specific transcription factor domain-containing protein [Fusarium redolens]
MATIPVKRGQVCDNCRFRKVKCDRGLPCKNCHIGDLRCQYRHSIRRKGPKQGQGRRQTQLRQGLGIDEYQFQILTSEAPPGSTSNSHEDAQTDQLNAQSFSSPPTNINPAPQTEPEPEITTPPNDSTIDTGDLCKRMSLSLVAHIRLFQRFLYPIMPVVDDDILADATRLDDLPPSRYALILAICAATRMQLRLDKRIDNCENDLNAEIPPEPRLTGDILVNLAENSLRQYSVIDDTTLDSVLVSFFLFASYGNLNDPRHAWFYLNQSITLAQSLDLTKESGYYGLPDDEREKRRRVFWLLFVTERTFALQHRRSVMLRSTVNKPQIVDSNCPVVMHDFINHIRLFESLPYSLYEWQPEGDDQRFDDLKLVHSINDKLCSVQPDQSIIESQRFDTLITQQWLRISMWRIAFGQNPSSASGFGLLLPPSLPMDAGKIIMSALGSVGTKSKDCHGIGMEQKLFDVGVSLADTAQLPGWTYSALENGPRDLLSVVIHALSTVRGAQSHLLPNLLKHSETLFALADPNAHLDLQWDMQEAGIDERPAIVEELSPEDEQPVDPLGWVPDGNLDLLDLSTPVVTTTWEDATISCGQFDPEIGLSFE